MHMCISDSKVQTFVMSEVLAKKLPLAVIMGNDFPIIPFLVQHTTGITEVRSLDQESGEAKMIPVKGTAKLCNVVTTKAQGTGDAVRKLPYISKTL